MIERSACDTDARENEKKQGGMQFGGVAATLMLLLGVCCRVGSAGDAAADFSVREQRMIRSKSVIENLHPSEIALLQFDSRNLDNYWLTSAVWNHHYASLHGHQYLYYSLTKEKCRYVLNSGDGVELASAWCKVRAMIQASHDYPDVKVFIYMDSDAVISKTFKDSSLKSLLQFMQQKLEWNVLEKPMVFNQDGPCWWCRLIKKAGYSMCLNAGTVLWYRHPHSDQILEEWWRSTMDDYSNNPLRRKFRTKWPWEQDRQMALYQRTPQHIQIASHPQYPMLIREKQDPSSVLYIAENETSFDGSTMLPNRDSNPSIVIKDWCLSHLPGCGCFINHFCANPASKQKMRSSYKLPTRSYTKDERLPFHVHELHMSY